MGFTKEYFELIETQIREIGKVLKFEAIGVQLRLAYGEEYEVRAFGDRADEILTFLYYVPKKRKLGVVMVPYSGIAWVRVNRADKLDQNMGFEMKAEKG